MAVRSRAVLLRTRFATFEIDTKGSLSALKRTNGGGEYLVSGQPSPILSVRMEGKLYAPESAVWDGKSNRLTLHFKSASVIVVLGVRVKQTHIAFEVLELQPAERVELVLWGPYPTRIDDIIGETVGVARDKEFAIGIQSLNAKTLGGYPTNESDIENEFGEDDKGEYFNLPSELTKGQGYRGDTARRTGFGSVLQAFCRNRNRERIISNWGHDKYTAPAFNDGGVIGSCIALFACPATKALETIGAIEVAEGLPHPLVDGVWGKVSPNATAAYLIVDFSESSIDQAIAMTQRAGLKYLYHSSPFETWGHFKLKPSLFPNGWDGLQSCVERARQAGIHIGFHTLSNFITPNDAYVTPKPDRRLAQIGASPLVENLSATQKEIIVTSPDVFIKNTTLNTVMIDDELIRYESVSSSAPWRLVNCQRGAWGTTIVEHRVGSSVKKLLDHEYQVFLTDAALSQEVARNIANLCNHAKTLQISMDGLEGNWSTGMGQYGRTLFTKAWYDHLAPELRGNINDASNPGHFNWHIATRMNWGEPWYAGFRESQTLYRFKNQVYFERNLMPRMLGWFALRPDTSMEDAEWLLARSAGFDAGFALASSLASTAQLEADPSSADTQRHFGATTAILEVIHQWEKARTTRAFPAPIKEALRDNRREFHLRAAGKSRWDLYEVHSTRFTFEPNESSEAEFSFQNTEAVQPLQWTLHSTRAEPVASLTLDINGVRVCDTRGISLPSGGNVKYSGGAEAVVTDSMWREVGRVPVNAQAMRIGTGASMLKIGTAPAVNALLKLELRTFSLPTRLKGQRASRG